MTDSMLTLIVGRQIAGVSAFRLTTGALQPRR
jgi:hypothetical protein